MLLWWYLLAVFTVAKDLFNYNKGDYNGMRQSIKINWKELLLSKHDDTDTTWRVFKQELQERILQFIPKMNNT